MELIDERSQAAASRDRRAECARFEALIAVRAETELQGAARALLDTHLQECTDCRAIADTMAPSDPPADHEALPAIDASAYALGSEIGRGGMGRIVSARDLRIGRPVAVKELLAKNAGLAARFEREARVTARLQHPGIVPIYEIGRWENGMPFYAMRMVEGQTLRAAVLERETLDQRLALLPSVIAAAEAVAFAHAHQVVHRDLTPANVMVGEYGETVVIDWGLAKDLSADTAEEPDVGPYRRDPSAAADLTAVGAVIGTAAYMPPEQAAGRRVDARADVYALGALLYYVLAGKAPFQGSAEQVLDAVKQERPAPLPARTPRDLVSIVGKAMARDPDARYPTAKELAAELTAFQAGRLVDAHEYTRGELVRRWIRKRRGVVLVAGLAAVTLSVLGTFAIRRIVDERDIADQERSVAERRRAESQALSTTVLIEQGRQEFLAGRHQRAAALLAEAYKVAPDDPVLRQLLGPVMRSIEAIDRIREPGPAGFINVGGSRIEASPSGKRYVVRGDKLWLSASEVNAPLVELGDHDAAEWPHWSPDERYITGASGSSFRIWDGATGKRVHEIDVGRPISWVGFTRDSTRLIALAVDGGWGVWTIASGERLRFVEPVFQSTGARPGSNHASSVVDELFPIALADGTVGIWDLASGALVRKIGHGGYFGSPFSTGFDGTTLVTCGMDGTIKRWNARDGRLLATMTEITGGVMICSLSATGRIATMSVTGALRVWSTDNVPVLSLDGDPSIVRFSSDGYRLVVQDGSSRETTVLDATTGTLIARLGVSSFVSAEGDRLFLGRPDGAVDVLRLGGFGIVRELPGYADARKPELDENARVKITDTLRGVELHDLVHDRRTHVPVTQPRSLGDDGTHVVGWGEHGITVARVSGEIEKEFDVPRAPYRLALSEDNRRVVGKFVDGKVVVWDVATGRVLAQLDDDSHDLVGFHHDKVVLWTQLGSLVIWDPANSRSTRLSYTAWLAEFSDDGRWAATSDGDHVEVVDTTTGERRLAVPGAYAAFDRAGSLFVRFEDEVSRWSTATWQRTGSISVTTSTASGKIAVHPNGSLVATSTGLWETGSGRQVARFDRGKPLLQVTGPGSEIQAAIDWISFSRDGTELRIQTPHGGRVIDVRPEIRGPDEIATIVARRQSWRVIDGTLVLPHDPRPEKHLLRVRGRALYHGTPVANAKVIAPMSGQIRQVAATAADGTFELLRAPGKYALTVHAEARGAFGWAELEAKDQPPYTDIALSFEASVAGRVVDLGGHPRADLLVVLESTRESDSGNATTAADGTFRITALKGSLAYTMKIIDTSTAAPIAGPRPWPVQSVPTATTHVEGLEIVVDDPPPPPRGLGPTVYYKLTTRWQPQRSLDGVNFQATGHYTGQLWKLSPVGNAFRLSTLWQGDAKRLAVTNDGTSLVENGSQLWTFEPIDGAYRIRPRGDSRCLAGGFKVALAACADVPEQKWLVTPTTAKVQ